MRRALTRIRRFVMSPRGGLLVMMSCLAGLLALTFIQEATTRHTSNIDKSSLTFAAFAVVLAGLALTESVIVGRLRARATRAHEQRVEALLRRIADAVDPPTDSD
jgi:hypothetical protein